MAPADSDGCYLNVHFILFREGKKSWILPSGAEMMLLFFFFFKAHFFSLRIENFVFLRLTWTLAE